jgi:hypothetical protein
VYWKFGGASVLTNRAIRLTPATQDRRGWLWNDFQLEHDDWEVEFTMKVGTFAYQLPEFLFGCVITNGRCFALHWQSKIVLHVVFFYLFNCFLVVVD